MFFVFTPVIWRAFQGWKQSDWSGIAKPKSNPITQSECSPYLQSNCNPLLNIQSQCNLKVCFPCSRVLSSVAQASCRSFRVRCDRPVGKKGHLCLRWLSLLLTEGQPLSFCSTAISLSLLEERQWQQNSFLCKPVTKCWQWSHCSLSYNFAASSLAIKVGITESFLDQIKSHSLVLILKNTKSFN